jgi:predicted MFS family arabinose efflux permease
VLLLVGCALVTTAGDSRILAIAGLLVFLGGFEYAFVSSLTLVTEAAPDARGRAVGISNAIGTLARGASVVIAGQLYEAVGINGTVAWVAAAALVALAMTSLSRPAERRLPGTP